MFFGQRRKMARESELVASGVSLWTEDFAPQARQKLAYAVSDLISAIGQPSEEDEVLTHIDKKVVRSLGLATLGHLDYGSSWNVEFAIKTLDTDTVLTVLEVTLDTVTNLVNSDLGYPFNQTKFTSAVTGFRTTVEDILREYWVAFDLVGHEFVPVASRELHEAVVIPALTLLGGDSRFADAELSYRNALKEIHTGNPEDAITDAATCLQVMLTSLGASGNTVSKCVSWGVNHGLLTGYDEKIGAWVEAYRSHKGDAHNANPATVADAWLIVHVVGSLVVRLAAPPTD